MLAVSVFLILLGTVLFLAVARVVPQQERWVVEVNGKGRVWGPGIHFLLWPFVRKKGVFVVYRHLILQLQDKKGATGTHLIVKVFNPDTPYDAGDGLQQTGVWRAAYVAPLNIEEAIRVVSTHQPDPTDTIRQWGYEVIILGREEASRGQQGG